jgi:hypothetical protein
MAPRARRASKRGWPLWPWGPPCLWFRPRRPAFPAPSRAPPRVRLQPSRALRTNHDAPDQLRPRPGCRASAFPVSRRAGGPPEMQLVMLRRSRRRALANEPANPAPNPRQRQGPRHDRAPHARRPPLLGIVVVDHLIVTHKPHRWHSMHAHGTLPVSPPNRERSAARGSFVEPRRARRRPTDHLHHRAFGAEPTVPGPGDRAGPAVPAATIACHSASACSASGPSHPKEAPCPVLRAASSRELPSKCQVRPQPTAQVCRPRARCECGGLLW